MAMMNAASSFYHKYLHLDILVLEIALRVFYNMHTKFMAPWFGRFLVDMAISKWFMAIFVAGTLLGRISESDNSRYGGFFGFFLIGYCFLLIDPVIGHVLRQHWIGLGAENGPIMISMPLFMGSFFLRVSFCKGNDLSRSSFGLLCLILLDRNSIIMPDLPMLCCNGMAISLVLIAFSWILHSHRHPNRLFNTCLSFALLVTIGISSSTIFAHVLEIRQCLLVGPSSATEWKYNDQYSVVARTESLTGFLSVVDARGPFGRMLLMKCDHSILGGHYLDYKGSSLGSIFSVFYDMSFVRFIKHKSVKSYHSNNNNNSSKDQNRALVIGLGTGTSAKILLQHNLSVDIVDIDPQVHRYARDFFELPECNFTALDGRRFVNAATEKSYDFVIHDVFSGGFLAPSLFSLEAFQRIKDILVPDGVLVLNYLGRPNSKAFQSVSKTLSVVFQYLLFRSETSDLTTIQNCLVFASNRAFEFDFSDSEEGQQSRDAMHNSALKRFAKANLQKVVTDSSAIVLEDKKNTLMVEQYNSSISFFNAMNNDFPVLFWSDVF